MWAIYSHISSELDCAKKKQTVYCHSIAEWESRASGNGIGFGLWALHLVHYTSALAFHMEKRAANVICIVILTRQSYNAICQLILTNRDNQINNCNAARKFWVSEANIQRWWQHKVKLINLTSTQKSSSGPSSVVSRKWNKNYLQLCTYKEALECWLHHNWWHSVVIHEQQKGSCDWRFLHAFCCWLHVRW